MLAQQTYFMWAAAGEDLDTPFSPVLSLNIDRAYIAVIKRSLDYRSLFPSQHTWAGAGAAAFAAIGEHVRPKRHPAGEAQCIGALAAKPRATFSEGAAQQTQTGSRKER